jgi:hypothetical protein
MGKFNENSKLKDILNDPRAVDILNKFFPGVLDNPGIGFILKINPSLKQLLPYKKQAGLSDDEMNSVLNELYNLE